MVVEAIIKHMANKCIVKYSNKYPIIYMNLFSLFHHFFYGLWAHGACNSWLSVVILAMLGWICSWKALFNWMLLGMVVVVMECLVGTVFDSHKAAFNVWDWHNLKFIIFLISGWYEVRYLILYCLMYNLIWLSTLSSVRNQSQITFILAPELIDDDTNLV